MSGESLRDAVYDGNVTEVKRLIEQEHALVNYVDVDDGWPLILWAIKSNQIECLELLLANGAHVHLADPSGNTALHKAAYLGNHSCCEMLINHGATINCRNLMNQTPIELAELFDRKQIVELLQKKLAVPSKAEDEPAVSSS